MARGSVKKRCQCRDEQGREVRGCKKAHGSWFFVIDAGRAGTGRRSQIKRGGFRSRVEASEAMTAELARIDAGTWTDDQGITVGQWLDQWLADLVRAKRAPKTMANYRGHVRDVWAPRLGERRLRDLRRHHIEQVLRDLGDPVEPGAGRVGRKVERRAAGTIESYRRTIRAALTAARLAGLVAANVAEGRMAAIPTAEPTEIEFWSLAETARFLERVAVHEWSALFEVAAYAGLRRGELLGARWSDLDGDGGGLTIRQTVVELASKDIPEDLRRCPECGKEHKGMLIKRPKSRAGIRWVPLVGQAQAALTVHRLAQAEQRRDVGPDHADHGLIFALPDGNPIRPNRVTDAHRELAAEIGLPPIRLHDMRHGACSLLLAGGVPIEVVQMILGHSSPAITRRVYAHVLRDVTAAQVGEAARLLDAHRVTRPRAGRPETGVTRA